MTKINDHRVDYNGEIEDLLKKVCQDFNIGGLESYKIVTEGYEDFNIFLKTTLGKYIVKVLSNSRTPKDRKRYLEIITNVLKSGLPQPKYYQSSQGILHHITSNGSNIYLYVIEFINGKSLYELRNKPNKNELKDLVGQIVTINRIDYKPAYYYDKWATVNLQSEFNKNIKFLDKDDISLIEPVSDTFGKVDLDKLPHCFVHGDILDTNIIKDQNGKFWIIDFSVSNFYPRILELAVFLSGPAYDSNNEKEFFSNYEIVLQEYQKSIKLSNEEVKVLPLFLKAIHAVTIVGILNYSQGENLSKESEYWLNVSRKGLKFMRNYFSD